METSAAPWTGNIAPGTTHDELREVLVECMPRLEIKSRARVERRLAPVGDEPLRPSSARGYRAGVDARARHAPEEKLLAQPRARWHAGNESCGTALRLSRIARAGLVGLLLARPLDACAQQLEPRTYANVPVGMNFLIGGFAYAMGGYAPDPALPLTNAQLKLQSPVLAYARSLDAWGKSAKFDVIAGGGCVSGAAQFAGEAVSRDVCGLLDPAARISVNFYGAPALGPRAFRHYEPDLVLGGSLQVQAPLGQYDPDRLVNLSTNRWTFRPEVGVSKTIRPLTVEFTLGASLFTTNDNFYGGKRREQDPIYNTQLHLIYEFPGGTWAALNATYYTGGRTTVDGVENNDELGNSRAGLTLAFPLNRNDSIKLYASGGISTRTGTSFDLLGVAWQHRWGAGF